MSGYSEAFLSFYEGLLVELQCHVNQNKISAAFSKVNFYSLGKVTSLLGGKSVFLP